MKGYHYYFFYSNYKKVFLNHIIKIDYFHLCTLADLVKIKFFLIKFWERKNGNHSFKADVRLFKQAAAYPKQVTARYKLLDTYSVEFFFLKNLVCKINLEDMHCLNRRPFVSKQVSASLKQASACFETSVCLFWDRHQPNLKQMPNCFEQVFRCLGKFLSEIDRHLSLNSWSSIW